MADIMLERQQRSWLDTHTHEWVDAGLISSDQAEAILEHEDVRAPDSPRRLPLLAEAASYVGSVLALMGGAATVGPNWDALGLFGQLAVAFAVTTVGFVAGSWLVHLGEDGTTRLGSFLWAVGAGGVAMAVVAVMAEIDPREQAWIPFAMGLPVLTIGLLLWRNLDRPLQLVTAVAGAGLTLVGVVELLDVSASVVGAAMVTFGVGFATMAALHRLDPRLFAFFVGGFSAWMGGVVLVEFNEHLGFAIALVIAVSVVVFALRERVVPLLMAGVLGSLSSTQGLLATTFTGAVASMVVTTIGLAIVIVTMMRARDAGDRPG